MYPSWSDNGTHKQYNLSATKKTKKKKKMIKRMIKKKMKKTI